MREKSPSTRDVVGNTVAIPAANICSASNRDPAPDQTLQNCLHESLSNISRSEGSITTARINALCSLQIFEMNGLCQTMHDEVVFFMPNNQSNERGNHRLFDELQWIYTRYGLGLFDMCSGGLSGSCEFHFQQDVVHNYCRVKSNILLVSV